MRVPLLALAGLCLAACQPESDKNNPAIATDETVAEREAAAPAVGANSFTQDQARQRIEAAGYTNVTALTQDPNGVWRATATATGQTQSQTVILDYQGNITTESAPADALPPASSQTTPSGSTATPPATSTTPTPTTPTEPNQ